MIAKRTGVVAALAVGLLLIVAAPAFAVPGDVLWSDQVHASGVVGDDTGRVLKVDGLGNAIIAGQWATTASLQQTTVMSYTPLAATRWPGPLWSGPGSTFETVSGMAIDSAGDSFTVGSTSTATGGDMYMLTVGSDGTSWVAKTYNGPADGNDEGMAVAVNAAGEAWYTGISEDTDGDMDVATTYVNAVGIQTWTKRYNSPYDRFDGGFAIAVNGNALYVAGISNRKGHGDDLILIRYNATTGARIWVRRYDDPLHRSELVSDIVATATDVYLCGSGKFGAVKGGDAMIARYSSSGVRKWVKFFSGGGIFDENFADMQRAPSGHIIVTGFASRTAYQQDWATVSYRTNGTVRWARWLTSTGKKSDIASALDIAGGRIYVTGSVESATHGSDVRTVCYSATSPIGKTLWGTGGSAFWNGLDDGDDVPWDVEVSSGAVWVTGTTFVAANGMDMLTIKYEK